MAAMNFMPPHDQARERWLAIRAAFLASLPPEWRAPIFVINDGGINDAGDASVNIELKSPVSQEVALAVGKAAEEAFGSKVTLNQWWTLEDVANGEGGPWSPANIAYLARLAGKS